MCADRVFHRITKDCSDEKYKEPIKPVEEGKIPIPKTASGTGNQYCPEAIVHYENSPYCFQYTSGGRTRYIPRG